MSDRKANGSASRSIFNKANNTVSDANDWASNGQVDIIRDRQQGSDSAFKKRNMTFDAGRDSNHLERKL